MTDTEAAQTDRRIASRIAAVMVTENRAPISTIAFASFAAQRYAGMRSLVVDLPVSQLEAYREQAIRIGGPEPIWDAYATSPPPVPKRKRQLVETVFDDNLADIIAVWDDDDYAPPDRLERAWVAISTRHPKPVIASYSAGYFCNARTLRGTRVDVPHLWGGGLVFNRAAYEAAGGYGDAWPGEDREFVRRAEAGGALVVSIAAEDESLPVAFMHGKNVATFPRGDELDLDEHLQAHAPFHVWREVKRFQAFCIERRIFPPGA